MFNNKSNKENYIMLKSEDTIDEMLPLKKLKQYAITDEQLQTCSYIYV